MTDPFTPAYRDAYKKFLSSATRLRDSKRAFDGLTDPEKEALTDFQAVGCPNCGGAVAMATHDDGWKGERCVSCAEFVTVLVPPEDQAEVLARWRI